MIVLGYDLGLALWASGVEQVLALLLSWFMPLLLVAGLALLLSLRFSAQIASALAYRSWLLVLALDTLSPLQVSLLTPLSEMLLGIPGLALLRLHTVMHRLLSRI